MYGAPRSICLSLALGLFRRCTATGSFRGTVRRRSFRGRWCVSIHRFSTKYFVKVLAILGSGTPTALGRLESDTDEGRRMSVYHGTIAKTVHSHQRNPHRKDLGQNSIIIMKRTALNTGVGTHSVECKRSPPSSPLIHRFEVPKTFLGATGRDRAVVAREHFLQIFKSMLDQPVWEGGHNNKLRLDLFRMVESFRRPMTQASEKESVAQTTDFFVGGKNIPTGVASSLLRCSSCGRPWTMPTWPQTFCYHTEQLVQSSIMRCNGYRDHMGSSSVG